MKIDSKLPNVGTTIFTVMSALANEHKAINLSQGFPNFDCPQRLKDLVNHYLQSGMNQYCPMAGVGVLRERLAEKVENLYNLQVDPGNEITVVAGATQGIFTAITAFVRKGDEVILIEPAYDCYAPGIEVVEGIPVAYELSAPEYRINWIEIEQMVTSRTRMIIINTPHNPIGKTLKAEDLKELQRITTGTDILVLSDEVYEHLVYDGALHQSVLRYPELFKRSLAVYSFGKTFHNTGWKVGYVVAPGYLMKEFRKVHQFNVFTVNSFVQYGIADFLQEPEFYLSLSDFYQRKRDFFQDAMEGCPLQPLTSEGTYFQLFEYGHLSDMPDTEFAKWMTTEIGVAAIPVSVFYTNRKDEKMIRLCFAKTEDLLEKAGALLRKM